MWATRTRENRKKRHIYIQYISACTWLMQSCWFTEKHFVWMHQYTTILIDFAAAQGGIAHLAISVQSWCQFWDFVCFQGTFWPNSSLCPDCTSLSAAAAEIKMRRKWECFCFEVEAANHTEPQRRAVVRQWTYVMSTCKYDTQSENCLKSHLLINIRRLSSRMLDFYIQMSKTWLRDPFFFRGRTSQWCVSTNCS